MNFQPINKESVPTMIEEWLHEQGELETPLTNEEAKEQIAKIKRLKGNWDGYYARKPVKESIAKAEAWVSHPPESGLFPSRILASATGGVGLVFITKYTRYAVLEFCSNGITILELKARNGDMQLYLVKE